MFAKNMLYILSLYWIDFWGQAEKGKLFGNFYTGVDGRNELAVKRCREIRYTAEFRNVYDAYCETLRFDRRQDYPEEAYKAFLETCAVHMHKTLIQTATTLMLYTAENSGKGRDCESLKKDWNRTTKGVHQSFP